MRSLRARTYIGLSLVALAAGAPGLGLTPAPAALWASLPSLPGLSRTAEAPPETASGELAAARPDPGVSPQQNTAAVAPVTIAPETAPIAQADAQSLSEGPTQSATEAPAQAAPQAASLFGPSPLDQRPGKVTNAVGAIAMATARQQEPSGQPASEAAGVTAYAPAPPRTPEIGPAPVAPEALIGEAPPQRADAPALREAIEAYRAGDIEKGDSAARNALDDLGRNALAWAAIRLQARAAGHERIAAFIDAHPEWPTDNFLNARLQDAMFAGRAKHDFVAARFAQRAPSTTTGRLALARAHLAAGRSDAARDLVRKVWREDDFGTWMESAIRKEFGENLRTQDHRFRADRLFYKGQHAGSLRAAGLVSKDFEALARARSAVHRQAAADKLMARVPAALRNDPTHAFARIQILRRANKPAEAADILAKISPKADLVDGDAWWAERKMISRRLLDAGDAKTAYKVAAEHSAVSAEDRIDAEFHAGWIALRFVGDAQSAARHFATIAELASTPISLSRAHYWQGRAAEALEKKDEAKAFYAKAAEHSSAYYGQLARARLGHEDQPVRRATGVARGEARIEPVRAVELFEAIGEKDLAFRLTVDLARDLKDDAQIAALGAVLARAQDARASLIVGKLASQRGIALDEVAFPKFGVPEFEPLPNSAEMPVVYAIARQESAFQAQVTSHAGAHGLMQMLTSTARVTARRAGVPFDEKRLRADPAFNAQLGAAHITDLKGEVGDSLILVFAAYNAGGPRVRQWIAAYGDPRDPAVDPIDWIERIPFTETRNYVQRVVENLAMYRARFGSPNAPTMMVDDLRARETRIAARVAQ